MFCNDEQEKWVLDYMCSGKSIIPYQMITDFYSLKLAPKDNFFDRKDFYSTLKEKKKVKTSMKTLKNFINF